MIDFVKVVLPKWLKQDLLSCPHLDFHSQFSQKTGVIKSVMEADYNQLKFIIHDGDYIKLQGSLHKFSNGGLHNYDNFGFSDLMNVLKQIQELFLVDLSDTKVENIEIGVNVKSPLAAPEILSNLLFHRGKRFEWQSLRNGNYKQVYHQRFIVKAYDKGYQYRELGVKDHNLLRFELKYIKMINLIPLGVSTLYDLTKPDVLYSLGQLLTKGWNQSFLFDPTIEYEDLRPLYQKKLYQWQSQKYWEELTKEKRCREKRLYNRLIPTHSKDIHGMMCDTISNQWLELCSS